MADASETAPAAGPAGRDGCARSRSSEPVRPPPARAGAWLRLGRVVGLLRVLLLDLLLGLLLGLRVLLNLLLGLLLGLRVLLNLLLGLRMLICVLLDLRLEVCSLSFHFAS